MNNELDIKRITILEKELFNLNFIKNSSKLKNFNLISKIKAKIARIKYNICNKYDTTSN
jgi:ribosomal protein L29